MNTKASLPRVVLAFSVGLLCSGLMIYGSTFDERNSVMRYMYFLRQYCLPSLAVVAVGLGVIRWSSGRLEAALDFGLGLVIGVAIATAAAVCWWR